VVVVEGDEELFDLTGFGIGQPAGDVLLGEVALLLSAGDETLGLLAMLGMDPDALRGRGFRGFLLFCRCLGHLYSCSVLRRTVDGICQVSGVQVEARSFLGELGQLCHQVTLERSRLFPVRRCVRLVCSKGYVRGPWADGPRGGDLGPEGLLVEPADPRERAEVE